MVLCRRGDLLRDMLPAALRCCRKVAPLVLQMSLHAHTGTQLLACCSLASLLGRGRKHGHPEVPAGKNPGIHHVLLRDLSDALATALQSHSRRL